MQQPGGPDITHALPIGSEQTEVEGRTVPNRDVGWRQCGSGTRRGACHGTTPAVLGSISLCGADGKGLQASPPSRAPSTHPACHAHTGHMPFHAPSPPYLCIFCDICHLLPLPPPPATYFLPGAGSSLLSGQPYILLCNASIITLCRPSLSWVLSFSTSILSVSIFYVLCLVRRAPVRLRFGCNTHGVRRAVWALTPAFSAMPPATALAARGGTRACARCAARAALLLPAPRATVLLQPPAYPCPRPLPPYATAYRIFRLCRLMPL